MYRCIVITPIVLCYNQPDTYDHRVWKIGLPVRSAVLKPHAGELVVGWVTTSESSLLYVFIFLLTVVLFEDEQTMAKRCVPCQVGIRRE